MKGDRQVYGFDYSYRFGKTWFDYSTARPRAHDQHPERNGRDGERSSAGPTCGSGINFTANWKDIPDDFDSIETEGFNRNEKSSTQGADLKRGRFDYGITYGNAMVDNQIANSTSTTGTTTTPDTTTFNARSTSVKAFASYSAADGTTWMARADSDRGPRAVQLSAGRHLAFRHAILR